MPFGKGHIMPEAFRCVHLRSVGVVRRLSCSRPRLAPILLVLVGAIAAWAPVREAVGASPDTDPPVITGWYSAAEHRRGIGEVLLEIPDDGSFCEPRSGGIGTLIVQFSEPIDPGTLTGERVQVAGLDAMGQAVNLSEINVTTATGDADTTAIISFSPPLPDFAKYVVRINGVTDGAGNRLDGDSDRVMTALVGDVSGDLRVNAADFSRVRAHRTRLIDPGDLAQVRADVNEDGRVNAADLSRVRARRGNDARGIADPDVPFLEVDGLVVMEAERSHDNIPQGQHSWDLVTDPEGYSGDGAMQALPDSGAVNDTGYETSSPRLDFRVEFSRSGTYYVWVRGHTSASDDDSVHVGANWTPSDTADRVGEFAAGEWFWESGTRDGPRATLSIGYTGVQTINVWMREDGFIFDKLILTTDPDFDPGPPTSVVHPIVLFAPADIPTIASRLTRGTGPRIMTHLSRNAGNGDILAVGMYATITGNTSYVSGAISSLISRANQNPGSSWLGNGGQLYEVAMGYDLLYNYMTPSQRDTVRARLEYLGQNVYNHGYSHTEGNWLPHVWGALSIAGFALQAESPYAQNWINKGREADLMYLDHTFDPEGADYEAFSRYFAMGMGKVLIMAAAERRQGLDLFGHRGGIFNNVVEFAAYMLLPSRKAWVPFDDAFLEDVDFRGLFGEIAGLTGDSLGQGIFDATCPPPSTWVGNPVTAAAFYDPDVPIERMENSPRLSLARAYWGIPGAHQGDWSSGHVFMRTGFNSSEDILFASQCGDTGGWHGHADQSTIALYAYGNVLVQDPAIVGSYHEPLNEWMKGPEAHSIVLIDGQATPHYTVGNNLNWPERYFHAGEIDGFIHSDDLDYVSMDFVEGLELNPQIPSADRGKRYVMFFRHPSRRGFFVVVDDVIRDGANRTYEWLLHPDTQHTIAKEGPGAFAFNGSADLKIRMIEPQDPAHTTATFSGYGVNYLRVRSQQARSRGLFFTVLYPLKSGMTMPQITEIRDGTVIGAEIGEDIVLFNQVRGGFIDTAGVVSDGELVALRISGGVVLKAIVLDGTTLTVNGTPVTFEAPGPRP